MSDDLPGLRYTTLNPKWRPPSGRVNLKADLDAMRERLRDYRERFDGFDTDNDGWWNERGEGP